MRNVSITRTMDPGFSVSKEDAIELMNMFEDRSSWTPVCDGGPAECEKRYRFEEGRIPGTIILQKWKDSDRIYATVVSDDTGTIIQANRFYITDVIPNSKDEKEITQIRLFSDGRMLSSVLVSEMEIEDKKEEAIPDEED